MTKSLVIAKAWPDQGLDWKGVFNTPEEKIFIYNVYERTGGESACYLSYIVDQYDNLEDYTWFLRGAAAEGFGQSIWPMERLSTEPALDFDYLATTQFRFNCEAEPDYCRLFSDAWTGAQGYANCAAILNLINKDASQPEYTNWFNQFAVKKSLILSKPKSYYQALLALLTNEHGGNDTLMSLIFHEVFLSGTQHTQEWTVGNHRYDVGYCKYRIA